MSYFKDAYAESVRVKIHESSVLGDLAKLGNDIAAECIVFIFGKLDLKLLADIAEGGHSRNEPLVFADFFKTYYCFVIVIIGKVSDKLLNEVGYGENTAHAAVLIYDNGKVVCADLFHVLEKTVGFHIFMDEIGFAHGVCHDVFTALVIKTEIVLSIENADNVIDIFAAYREI